MTRMKIPTQPELAARRAAMVAVQLRQRGILDPLLLDVFREVPRHEFVLPKDADKAYGDFPLEIGEGQTISQPYIVALTTQALELTGDETVLDIGTGSGYQAAILSRLVHHVYTIEWYESLAERARNTFERLGYNNITTLTGNGSQGHPVAAPYDAIAVSAASPSIPATLKEQLSEDGRLVIPVGGLELQDLLLLREEEGRLEQRNLSGCRFVPLTGKFGWYDLSLPPN